MRSNRIGWYLPSKTANTFAISHFHHAWMFGAPAGVQPASGHWKIEEMRRRNGAFILLPTCLEKFQRGYLLALGRSLWLLWQRPTREQSMDFLWKSRCPRGVDPSVNMIKSTGLKDRAMQEKAMSGFHEKKKKKRKASVRLKIPAEALWGSIFYTDGPPSDPLIPFRCMRQQNTMTSQQPRLPPTCIPYFLVQVVHSVRASGRVTPAHWGVVVVTLETPRAMGN